MSEKQNALSTSPAQAISAAEVEPALLQLVADTIDEARKRGASAAEASLSKSNGLSVNVRLGEVETIEHIQDKGLGVTVYFGQRKGSASTTDFSPDAIRSTVASACTIARYTAEDSCSGLAEAELMATEFPDLDLYHPWNLDAEQAIAMALQAEQVARDHDVRITNSEGAGISRQEGLYVYGNSNGFLHGRRGSRHSMSCSVIAEDNAGMQRDYYYTMSRVPQALDAPEHVGATAAARTIARLGSRQVRTQSVPVIFRADLARGLIQHFIGAIRGGALYRKASFLLDHVGKQVFPNGMRIHEQPHLPRALGSASHDDEGVATQSRDVVADGILQNYVLDSYSGRQLGLPTTGNAGGVHNLIVEAGEQDLSALIAQVENGLLVTELMGMGVKMITGDYSRGAAGFWIENGVVQFPVHEVTIAGNLREMFMGIQAVGSDVDARGNIRTGSILIDRMTIAGE